MKSNFFLILAIGLLLFSCNKKNEDPNCLAVITPVSLKFNLVDRESQQDVFFAQDAVYQISDLKIYKSTDVKHEQPLKIVVEGDSSKKNFSISLDGDLTSTKSATLEFLIGASTKHILDYSVSMVKNPCPEYKIDEINFNQTIVTPSKGIYMLIN